MFWYDRKWKQHGGNLVSVILLICYDVYQRRKPQNVKKKIIIFFSTGSFVKILSVACKKIQIKNKNAKKWNKPKSPSLKQWMDAVNDIYVVESSLLAQEEKSLRENTLLFFSELIMNNPDS